MKITLQRIHANNESTIGILSIDGIFAAFTIEDECRAVKVKAETRIPSGTYKVLLRKEGGHHESYKKKFPAIHKGMLWLQDVPGFQYILIHIGNTDLDSEGCILIGDAVAQNVSERGAISGSGNAYARIYPKIANALEAGQTVTIEVYDEKKA